MYQTNHLGSKSQFHFFVKPSWQNCRVWTVGAKWLWKSITKFSSKSRKFQLFLIAKRNFLVQIFKIRTNHDSETVIIIRFRFLSFRDRIPVEAKNRTSKYMYFVISEDFNFAPFIRNRFHPFELYGSLISLQKIMGVPFSRKKHRKQFCSILLEALYSFGIFFYRKTHQYSTLSKENVRLKVLIKKENSEEFV